MTAAEFLAVRGVDCAWLESLCNDLASGDTEDAEDVLALLSDMILSGVALPPAAAALVSGILQDVAGGLDARERVGTKPGRGAPKSDTAAEKHRQANACVQLLKLAGIKPTNAVELVALATPMNVRDVFDLPTEEPVGGWNAISYFAEIGFGNDGNGVLRRLIRIRPSKEPKLIKCWEQFGEFCAVRRIS